ncbi:hypothetical protein SLEP1_g55094 [Rubroshorea leprosula]|uniref:Uncharacterized protein n=1 Tax=Rubroshorea leprosula TaxID=152421 RepID=A0AAV5MFK8_9ROSI|nr:hypothetical protein SLEP1_g55094 [Rubroshorea leprosula]
MAELFFLFLLPYPRDLLFFFSTAPDKPPKPPTFFPLEKPGGILMNSLPFLLNHKIWGLESSLSTQKIPDLLCSSPLSAGGYVGLNFWAFFGP